MKNAFDGLIILDPAEKKKISDISIETSKMEKPRKKNTDKNRTEYLRTVRQLQNVKYMQNWNTRRNEHKKYLKQ